ncbi:M28 family peptidase [Acuticoccus sediminis]|uniref:M28 family peptidase n=1 Tax=Acuticoccus sediminis TaxID=2184697 RepID=UPI001CFF1F2D|nr:M28 family peptidase [Acuticoccus sediminis]
MTDRTDSQLLDEFNAICDCGGRLSGTPSEEAATALMARLGAAATGVEAARQAVPYTAWRADAASLVGPGGRSCDLQPLLRCGATPAGGIEAEVLDLGRGTPEAFEAHAGEIPGRIVMVRHELMFSADTIHRRVKIQRAIEAGAAGFLIVGPAPGMTVSGSASVAGAPTLPAAGISPETAAALCPTAGARPRVRLTIAVSERASTATNLLFDVPADDGCVVLSAHIDGHDPAESAIDNGSGLAVALEVARRAIARRSEWARGLRVAFFNVEEWALTGSEHYVAALSDAERAAIALNVNLDSVAGGASLTALTSGFAGIEPFLLDAAGSAGIPLGLHRPFQSNSDHANFARAGIPAFRLVAGFGDTGAAARYVLTARDTRSAVQPGELTRAARLSEAILMAALTAPADATAAWRRAETA